MRRQLSYSVIFLCFNRVRSLSTTEWCCWCVEICRLAAETGPCRATKQRYFYDTVSSSCRRFTYGGCNGNANRFLTLDNCRRVCEQQQRNVSGGGGGQQTPADGGPTATSATTLSVVDGPTRPATGRRLTTTPDQTPAATTRQPPLATTGTPSHCSRL